MATFTCHWCDEPLPDNSDILCASCSYAMAEEDFDPTPCCPDPECGGNPCTFPGYAANH